ncbi:MAG: hypothetical protein MR759_02925, partial [Ruminococcus sp.]|nr:hypothetical protein [Ruminococcus sp.]
TVEFYKSIGYSGLVITDHYSFLTFGTDSAFKRQIDVDKYLKGYHCALEAAGDDFTVLLGMEIRYFATTNDYLVYGIDEDFLRKNGNMLFKGPRRFYKLVKESGAIIVQAHPFRPYIHRANPKYIDGCEIFNGKDKDKDLNQKAQAWAKKEKFQIVTGGADYHRESQRGNVSGIITEEKINTNDDLVRILRNGRYEINMG